MWSIKSTLKYISSNSIVLLFLTIIITLRVLVINQIPLNWDTPIFIDGSYRVFKGQLPHVDFSTPVGELLFFFGAIGMKISTASIVGFNIGILILGCSLLLFFCLNIQLGVLKSLHLLLLGSLLFTPRMLSYGAFEFGYTGYYNVIGYSIIYILIFILNQNNLKMILNGYFSFRIPIFSALLVVALFFIKITFFIAAVFLVFIHLILSRFNRDFIIYFCGSFIFFTLFACFIFDFNFQAIYRDLKIVYISRSSEEAISIVAIIKILKANFIHFAAIIYLIFSTKKALPNLKKDIILYGFGFIFISFLFH